MLPGAALLGCQNNSGNQVTFEDADIDAPAGTPVSIIEDNHPHAPHKLVIPSADVSAGVTKMYGIRNCANHEHIVTLTATDFANLTAGMTITTMAAPDVTCPGSLTDPNAHTHMVMIKLNECPSTTADACDPVNVCSLGAC